LNVIVIAGVVGTIPLTNPMAIGKLRGAGTAVVSVLRTTVAVRVGTLVWIMNAGYFLVARQTPSSTSTQITVFNLTFPLVSYTAEGLASAAASLVVALGGIPAPRRV
jgi:hypothetical protein